MRLSIIIPSINGIACLQRCVQVLQPQLSDSDEVIIVDCTAERASRQLKTFPGLSIHMLDHSVEVPELRSIGVLLAQGDILAMTEDHCIPDYNWCDELRRLHRQYPEQVIGGAVENGVKQTMVDWACYFCEYSDFMLPLRQAPGGPVPGTNVSYKRQLVEDNKELFLEGSWDYFLHPKLKRAGAQFRMDSRLRVLHSKSFTPSQFRKESFRMAHSFAAARLSHASFTQRWIWRLLSPALPVLKTTRHVRKMLFDKRRHLREFFGSLGWVIWFQCVWAVGESLGYWKEDRLDLDRTS